MLRTSLLRLPRSVASSSRLPARALSSSAVVRRDVLSDLEEHITPRELVERKRKEYEAKYGDKLKKKVENEGVTNLDELREKVKAPSVMEKIRAKEWAREEAEQQEAKRLAEEAARKKAMDTNADAVAERQEAARAAQAAGDRAGVKPLASIINLPLILMTPHDAEQISAIWNTYHTTHPTLANSYLSATLPAATYESMLKVAAANSFFVLPLPRDSSDGGEAFEMFYMQWLFHPAPVASPDLANINSGPLPPVTSVIFTPLAEFKANSEWAQPYLTLTQYPDLSKSHGSVLMRGEITAETTKGPAGALDNPGFLLTQQQAQLLTLALQRFYCADMPVPGETAEAKEDRLKRLQALTDFREKPENWDWQGLINMAYAGFA